LGDYVGQCPKDYRPSVVYKKINQASKYYSCCFDYAEDLQNRKIEGETFFKISIDENFVYKDCIFELASIVYFQGMHYTTHIKGVYHPKFRPQRDERWFYHDGMKLGTNNGSYTKGLLFESQPSLEFDLMKDELKPYILIYRVIWNSNTYKYKC